MPIGSGPIGTVPIGTGPVTGGGPSNYLIFNFTVSPYTPPTYNNVIFNFGGGAPPAPIFSAGGRISRGLAQLVYAPQPEFIPPRRSACVFISIDDINITILW